MKTWQILSVTCLALTATALVVAPSMTTGAIIVLAVVAIAIADNNDGGPRSA